MIEVEKLVYVTQKSDDDCECISEVNMVQIWNKLMMIRFQDNVISEDCVTNERFAELLASNVQKNFQKVLKDIPELPKRPKEENKTGK